ncbi:crocetin glucosyltransferase chloroplastic-like [Prunus yedoensis var. nudiflora]|uniref:Glycosyltransferase n=1 Tax=Prunus yedoensis var. nudiflora TaxID=2094558 RepID=A0A314XXV9_PRUYE|nr:crocetin glucosyltransferase chloroplastic-like [Prunus yedoensis var. nudiflora]
MDIKHHHHHHFLLVSCPAQGHINPTLQLAKRLIEIGGTHVTYATTIHSLTQIKSFPSLEGLSYASFSDGFDDGIKPTQDPNLIMSEFKLVGSKTLKALIEKISTSQDHSGPVTFLIYSVLLPWAAEVASDCGIPSAFLCIQSTTSFALCHHYFNHFHNCPPFPNSITIEGLPPFAPTELPSFLLPTSPHVSFIPTFQEHIQVSGQGKPNSSLVLLNTFDALEEAAIKALRSASMNVIPIGPLVITGFWEESENQSSDAGFRCDLFDKSEDDYLQWLDSKPDCSVCLCVIWEHEKGGDQEAQIMKIKNRLKIKEQGLVVPWCSQMEVLRHKSVGCFVMHCGWNSTVESLVAGVPMVGCAQFSDQNTNAKLVEEVWGVGVRAKENEEGVIGGAEIKRCLEIVMGDGERGEEIRRNCEKWKGLAKEAVKEGGSSDYNLRHFIGGLG